jgi:protein required for attachment to host cells
MALRRTVWLAIADGEHARFVSADANNALHTQHSLDSISAHQESRDLGTDRPGRSFESGTTGRHAFTPRHDPHELEKAKFAHLVARQLEADAGEGKFDDLVLVAPAHVLAEIRDALDVETAARVVGTLAKDLTKVPDHELWPHVREWFPPTHRAS